jgi:hypothetical protein
VARDAQDFRGSGGFLCLHDAPSAGAGVSTGDIPAGPGGPGGAAGGRVAIVNDNNLPFGRGRSESQPDATELIVVQPAPRRP